MKNPYGTLLICKRIKNILFKNPNLNRVLCMGRQSFPQRDELLNEYLSASMGYVPTSYWLGRLPEAPQTIQGMVALFAHNTHMVRLYCRRSNTLTQGWPLQLQD